MMHDVFSTLEHLRLALFIILGFLLLVLALFAYAVIRGGSSRRNNEQQD
jgi:hypothetical protein